MLETIENIESLDQFKQILENNPGLVIIKFGAEWCKPCQTIESHVLKWFEKMPDTIQTVLIDVDESFELYAFMKSKKMIQGIPAILMYEKGNVNYVFDDNVAGAKIDDINSFFKRCLDKIGADPITPPITHIKPSVATPTVNMPFPLRVNVPHNKTDNSLNNSLDKE